MKGKDTSALNTKIKNAEGLIARNPKSAVAYAQKAAALAEIGRISGDDKNYSDALAMYDKAIEYSPGNQQYIIQRSNLHATMGNTRLAAQDAKAAQEEMEKSGSTGSTSSDIAFRKSMKDILKLDSVQKEIDRMIKDGELTEKLSGVFQDIFGVIAGISTKVSEHDDRLDVHDEELKVTKERLAKLEQEYPDCIRLIKSMGEKIGLLEKQIEQQHLTTKKIEEQIMHLVPQDEFDALLQKLSSVELNETFFEGRLKLAEGKLDNQDKLLVTMDEALQKTGIYKEQEIKGSFEELKVSNSTLYEYATSFNWTLNNYLLAYRAIGTGIVSGVREKSSFESTWEKIGTPIMSMLGIVPVVGGILPAIEAGLSLINNTYKNMAFDRKAQKINSIITGSNILLEKDLSLAVAKSAVEIAKTKEYEIIEYCQEKEQAGATNKGKLPQSSHSPLQQASKAIDKAIDQFNENINLLLSKTTHISKTDTSHAREKAIKDVILFINYVATNDNAINTQGSKNDPDKAITEAFHHMSLRANGTNAALSLAVNQNTSVYTKNSTPEDCIICKVDQITYDNELLNHPALLKLATSYYGSSKAIELGSKLSKALIEQIAAGEMMASETMASEAGEHAELLLAGLMSVDHDPV